MGARWYNAQLGRWISADTIVPNFANPQSLNRYSYVYNNPLKYVDPTGHDLMIVGGWNNNNWEDPDEWKEWIMAYKGWTTEEWEDNFYDPWQRADDAGKQQLMAANSIFFFDWTACDCMDDFLVFGDDPHQNASREAYVKDMLGKLEAQLIGLKDVTLIGHSKGGNLVINYMQRNGKYVKNAVIIDAVWKDSALGLARAMGPIMHETAEHPLFEDMPANIVNIFNIHDPVNSGEEGWYVGDVVNLMVDEAKLTERHSTKGWLAWHTLYKEFNVEFDHGSKHRGHGTRGR
jgi:pimeloyl-ACP methyl ester carboxylesterase